VLFSGGSGIGTIAADNAPAGTVGEIIDSGYLTGVAIATATNTNLATISLTAGDWDIYASIVGQPAGTTTTQYTGGGISFVSATLPANNADYFFMPAGVAGASTGGACPIVNKNISATTTVYLVGLIGYSVSTLTAACRLYARRRR
jgi:hypothetical protein